VRNLELVEPLFSGESAQTTLFYTLDACSTPMGRRLLRSTLLRPASHLAEIQQRLDAVAGAAADLPRREGLRRALGGLLDLERLLGRVALDSAGPRELVALAGAMACLPGVRDAVSSFHSRRWRQLAGTGASADKISTEAKGQISGELSTGGAEISTGIISTECQALFDALEDLHSLIAAT